MNKHEILKTVFGHDGFREGQEGLIDALLSGRDVLGVMPTGAGKSVCFQIPALLLPGVTLVISPLISLMKDQVMALKAAGVAAAYINSSLTPSQQAEAIRRAALGTYKIIYVAPERLDMGAFLDFARNADVSLLAVDEAHCVSQWGQDFRPSYLHIEAFVRALPKRPPVAAFTATATMQVRKDIVSLLCLNDPLVTLSGFNRPNLRFTSLKPANKPAVLLEFLSGMHGESGIVYCATRKAVEEVTELLKGHGFRATRYHAGLSDAERHGNQDDFQYDRARIMVATNAFGMGIDKSNVRFVIHYNMPKDIESYYQEAGRAGRDGESAECVLLYNGQDVYTAKWLIEHGDANPDITPEQRLVLHQRDLERLKQMTFYATSKRCLRGFLLRYFGETGVPERCGNCSVCEGEAFEVGTRAPKAHPKAPVRRAVSSDLTAWEQALLENLKTLRTLLAAARRVPAYIVFTDATLVDMARKKPQTMEEFLNVSGVGETKRRIFGQAFLSVIRDGREPNEALEMFMDDME